MEEIPKEEAIIADSSIETPTAPLAEDTTINVNNTDDISSKEEDNDISQLADVDSNAVDGGIVVVTNESDDAIQTSEVMNESAVEKKSEQVIPSESSLKPSSILSETQKSKEKAKSVRFALEEEEEKEDAEGGDSVVDKSEEDAVAIPAPPASAPAVDQQATSSTIPNYDQTETAIPTDQFNTFNHQNNNLPPIDKVELFKKRIESDRKDGEAWLGLIEDAASKADLPLLRSIYEEFFQIFPNASRQWQDYASVELSHSEFGNVESIFTKCLRTTPSTDLWKFYLSYTRRVNPLPPPSGASSANNNTEESERERVRKVIEGAYEFALRFIGQSRDAGDVWRDYITLLKERETSNQWQAGQKMDDVRRAYQRAVAIPLANVEQIWREYDMYENGLNRITAKKFLGDRSAAYMTARSIFKEMRTLTDDLYRPILPKVPCWAMPPSLEPIVSPLTVVRDRHSIELWKKYLRWEEGNPLQLEDEQALQSRIMTAYRKAVMHMRFYPEIWYMASIYLQKNGREDESVTWLKNGMEACSGSSLLAFAFIEQAERQGQTQGCNAIFDGLLEWTHTEIDKMNERLEEKIRKIDQEADQRKAEAAAKKRDEGAAEGIEGEERETLRKMEEEREERRTFEREQVRPKVEEMKEYASLVWIKYMHFARRVEGQRPSRAIFARARKSKYCTWQVFEANSLMEYHTSKDVSVATKVFELALKSYGNDEAFVVRYLDFLLAINDDNNARALFERTVGNFSPDRARPIWDRWSEYEYSFGDSASIARIEQRLQQVYPDENATKRLMNRNTYMDLDVVGPRDLGIRTITGTGSGTGASAAERATIASREMAEEFEGTSFMASATAAQQSPMMKRQRLESNTPPPGMSRNGGAGIPTGPRGVKRSMSPPSRYVPPPRNEQQINSPQIQSAQSHSGTNTNNNNASHQYLELPEGILYLMNALPKSSLFDGPIFSAESIVDSLLHSTVHAATELFSNNNHKPSIGGGGGGRGGGRSGGGRRGGRGGRRF